MWVLLQSIRFQDVVDIAVVAFVLYRVFLTLHGVLAAQMLTGLGLLMAARFVARKADLLSLSFVLENFWAFWVLAFVVLFQPELRRTLTQVGQSRLFQRIAGEGSAAHAVLDEVARAVDSLVAKRLGALIVLERSTALGPYAELGVAVDAAVSAELLGSLFLPASPLHDGATLIQDGRISAAGCFLPLSRNLQLARSVGSRHRAALGLSEETDAVVVVVSEETGAVSVAVDGRLESGVDPAALRVRLGELLGLPARPAPRRSSLIAGVRRLGVRGKA